MTDRPKRDLLIEAHEEIERLDGEVVRLEKARVTAMRWLRDEQEDRERLHSEVVALHEESARFCRLWRDAERDRDDAQRAVLDRDDEIERLRGALHEIDTAGRVIVLNREDDRARLERILSICGRALGDADALEEERQDD